MGRILAGVLLLAACGDNGVEQPGVNVPGSVDTVELGGDGMPTPRLAPAVCGGLEWTTSAGTGAIEMSVVPRASGAQVLAVPLAGGAIDGYTLDKRMNLQQVAPSISIDSGYTSVSASMVGTTLTATGVSAGALRVNLVADDLSQAQEVAKLDGGLIAKPAFQVADGKAFIPVADGFGLRIEEFDGAWNATTTRVATTDPAIAMTATAMQYATVAAWSTKSTCYMMTLFTNEPGPVTGIHEACDSPHLAIDPVTQNGVLVFQTDAGIRVVETQHTSMAPASRMLRTDGTAPRVLWDGNRFWVSFIDKAGEIIVGTLEDGHYTTTAVSGVRPSSGAYDLVMIDGSVWAVSFDAQSYQANRICVMPTNG